MTIICQLPDRPDCATVPTVDVAGFSSLTHIIPRIPPDMPQVFPVKPSTSTEPVMHINPTRFDIIEA